MPFLNDMMKGTLILTMAGLFSRFLGFYNRIFLSNFIGAKELGIYQLIFPIYMVGFSICCSGIQVALSKMISSLHIQHKHQEIKQLMNISLFFCLILSLSLGSILYFFAPEISIYFIKEPRCVSSLRIALLSLPFVALKSCLHGYYLGLKKTAVSATSQLFEQIMRVSAIYILSTLVFADSPSAILAAYGMLIGEITSFLYTFLLFLHSRSKHDTVRKKEKEFSSFSLLQALLKDSIPLTANRLSLTLLQSLEAILIPSMLQLFYQDSNLSLELYGILTGMALPFLFFPSTLTNSLSVMLLPTISAAKTKGHQKTICTTTNKSIHFCVSIGIMSAFFFLLYGKDFGNTIFSNTTAGEILFMLALLCPFLYISSCLSSILNGLGYTKSTLWHNLISICIRIGFILFVIPIVGIKGYMWGLLASYMILLCLDLMKLSSLVTICFSPLRTILLPSFFSLVGGFLSNTIYEYLLTDFVIPQYLCLSLACAILGSICLFYLLLSKQFL